MRYFPLVFALAGWMPLAAQRPAVRPHTTDTTVARLTKENDSLRERIAELTPRPKVDAKTSQAAVPGRSAATHPGSVTEKFDDFKNTTVVMLKDLPLIDGLKMTMVYSMPGTVPSRVPVIGFWFFKQGTSWEYLQCHQLDMVAAGKPLDLTPSTHTGTVGSGYVLEYIQSSMSVDDAIRLSASPDSKMRICATEYMFGDLDRVAMADFLSRMAPTP